MAKAITNSQAIVSMANCDDSIAEIDAMIPRLLRMKKQLIAQKEYIEVALKDANDLGNTNAASAVNSATNQNAKIVDFRANLYKHQQKIQRLASASTTDGTQNNDITTETTTSSNIDITRAKKNGGGGGDIFNTSQKAPDGTDTQEKQTADIFDGVDLVGTKKFLIGVNAILTQSNDIINNSGSTEAIVPYSLDPSKKGNFSNDYDAGGIHIINEEVLRGLIMQGNSGQKGADDLSEENGITIREVAGEEIIADESFAQITSRPTNMTDNASGWLIPDENNALTCTPAATTNLKPTLIVSNNKLLKVKVEKDNIGEGHKADDVFTVSKDHIPGTSDMTGNIYVKDDNIDTNDRITQNINGDNHIDGFYKITSSISASSSNGNNSNGTGMNILIQIESNRVKKIIIIAGTGYQSGDQIVVSVTEINSKTSANVNSINDLEFNLSSEPGNYDRFVYDTDIEVTNATDGISQISEDNIITREGSVGENMSIIATVETDGIEQKIKNIVIIPEGGDIRGYQSNERLTIDDTALPGSSLDDKSSSIGDFTLKSCPSCCDNDLVLKLIKVPGDTTTNTTATDNRGKKIRGFGL